jgi:hypothetical protein
MAIKFNLFTLLSAATAIMAAAQVAGEVEVVLDDLADNDYPKASADLLENDKAQEYLATLPEDKQTAIKELLPDVLALVDAAIPEEVILKAFHKLGIGS